MALWVAFTGWAQSTIRVDVHNIVELSERFNVVFIVEGEHAPSEFQWNPGDDFTLVWGPQKGTSTSVSIVNGKTTRSSQTSYTYILQAKKTGTFTFAPATATVKGDQIRSKSVQITVVEGRDSGAGAAQGQGGSAQGGEQQQARPSTSNPQDLPAGQPDRLRGCQVPEVQRFLEPGGGHAADHRLPA